MYKSIHKQFLKQLILATTLFVIILSFMFYGFTKTTIAEEIRDNLISDAQLINTISKTSQTKNIPFSMLSKGDVEVDIIYTKAKKDIMFNIYNIDNNYYANLIYPFKKQKNYYIKIVKNVNSSHRMLNTIFKNLLILTIAGIIMVILYALTISRILVAPILHITNKLSHMNENSLVQITLNKLPVEFHPLANSINQLTNRIEGHVKYQKELFIGAAHELKTPLAVMKLKNDITIRKQRTQDKYEETIKINNNEIDTMNKMISSILDIGRQEGATFEQPVNIDIIKYLREKFLGYKLLANKDLVKLSFITNVNSFFIIIQPTLLNQIIQNFVQNAIKFTPNNNSININTYQTDSYIEINVIDSGIGIDESIDLFAPFKRVGKKQGAGLGLFLAKSAADALGAKIGIRNRTDGVQGCVASLKLYTNPICKII
jgi:two-component system, OmpR family, sensor kinase